MRPLLSAIFAFTSAVTLAGPALAQTLPAPKFTAADPQMVYSNLPGWLDANGQVAVTLRGENLAPKDGMFHPTGFAGGYQHIWVRNAASSVWLRCDGTQGCRTYGSTNPNALSLGFDPAKFLGAPASHTQVKMWVSSGPATGDDPNAGAGQGFSGWSNVWTVDVAAAGAKPAAPAPSPPPTLTKVQPNEITLGPGQQDFRIRLYGEHLCGEDKTVIFNGDVAAAVPTEEPHCKGVDDDGSFLKGGISLVHVVVPAKFRTVGTLKIVLKDRTGQTNPVQLTIKGVMIAPNLRVIPAPGSKPETVNPGIAKPPLTKPAH